MSLLSPGFAKPALESQSVFRAMMNALSFPGRIIALASSAEPPAPLTPEAAALVLALCDADTRLFLAPSLKTESIETYLRFHTGTQLTDDPKVAGFALLDLAHDSLTLGGFALGQADYPDRSTTIIAQVQSLTAGTELTLRGPGIAKTAPLKIAPLPADFDAQWMHNRSLYPLGVDMVFVANGGLVGLPRSSTLLKGAL